MAASSPVVPAWSLKDDGTRAFAIFPNAPASCDEMLSQSQALLCVADKLLEVSQTIRPLTWTKVSELPPIDGLEAGPWVVPVQADPFVTRDLALHLLASVAIEDMSVPTSASVEMTGSCADWYAQAVADPAFAGQHSQQIFGVSAEVEPLYFPPHGVSAQTGGAALATSRLSVETHILRAAGRVLATTVKSSVDGDLGDAQVAFSRGGADPNGATGAWGVDGDVHTSFKTASHAFRSLGGRLELGVGAFDPACQGLTAGQAFPALLGNDVRRRVSLRAPSSAPERRAVALVASSGIVLPVSALDGSPESLRAMLVDQALGNAGAPRGNAPAGLAGSDEGRAVAAVISGVSRDDLSFAFRHVSNSFLLSRGIDDLGSDAVPGVAPAAYTSPAVLSAGGIVVGGGVDVSLACRDTAARLAAPLAAAQCSEAAAGGDALNPDRTYAEAFQGSYPLAQTLSRRLVRLREAVRGAGLTGPGSAAERAGLAVSELRAWAGNQRSVLVSDSSGGSVTIHVFGLDAASLATTNADSLKPRFVLVKGSAYDAECAGRKRKDCSASAQSLTALPSAVVVKDPSQDPTQAASSGTDGFALELTFDLQSAPNLVSYGGKLDPSSLLYLVRTDGLSRSAVVAAFAPPANASSVLTSVMPPEGALRPFSTCATPESETSGTPAEPAISGCFGTDFAPEVPVANELSTGGDPFEDSWKHYLQQAKDATARADDLARQLIDAGSQLELRREGSGDDLARICGIYPDATSFEVDPFGRLSVKPGNASLTACLDTPKYDFTFLTEAPDYFGSGHGLIDNPDQRSAAYHLMWDILACASHPEGALCNKLAGFETAGNIYYYAKGLGELDAPYDPTINFYVGSLGLGPYQGDLVPGASEECKSMARALAGLGDGTGLGAAFPTAQVANAKWSRLAQLKTVMTQLSFDRYDAQGNWRVAFAGAPVMDSAAASGLWPGCVRASAVGAGKATCELSAELFANLFVERGAIPKPTTGCSSPAYVELSGTQTCLRAPNAQGLSEPQALGLIMWRVQGAIWLLGGMSGEIPASAFSTMMPIADFNLAGWSSDPAANAAPLFALSSWNSLGAIAPDGTIPPPLDETTGAVSPPFLLAYNLYARQPSSGGSALPQNHVGGVPQWLSLVDDSPSKYALVHTPVAGGGIAFPSAQNQVALANWLEQTLALGAGVQCGIGGITDFESQTTGGAANEDELWSRVALAKRGTALDDGYGAANQDCFGEHFNLYVALLYPNSEALSKQWLDGIVAQSLDTVSWADGNPRPGDICAPQLSQQAGQPPDGRMDVLYQKCTQQNYLDPLNAKCEETNSLLASAVTGSGNLLFDEPRNRAFASVNSYLPFGACGAASQLLQALGLACHFAQDPGFQVDGQIPTVDSIDGFARLSAWMDFESVQTRRQLSRLHLEGVPTTVVEDFRTGRAGTGTSQGQHGSDILALEQGVQGVYSGWLEVSGHLAALHDELRNAQLQIDVIDLQADIDATNFVLQTLHVHQSEAQAIAGAVSSMTSVVGGIGGVAGAAAAAYFGQQELDQLQQLHDLQGQMHTAQIQVATNELNKTTQLEYTALATSLSSVRSSTMAAIAAGQQIQMDELTAQHDAAVALGEDFAYVAGQVEPLDLPVNRVLSRQYDATTQRYQTAFYQAKRAACAARISIEEKLGVRLYHIGGTVQGFPAPAGWADSVITATPIDFASLSCSDSTQNSQDTSHSLNCSSPALIAYNQQTFVNKYLGDYVNTLGLFVDSYNGQYPFHDTDDTVILSLANDILSRSGVCSRPSINRLRSPGYVGASTQYMGAQVGWTNDGCSDGWCPQVLPIKQPPLTPQMIFATWLSDTPDPAGNNGTTPRFFYQDVPLTAGSYVFSWNVSARAPDGSPASTAPDYLIGVFRADGSPVMTVPRSPDAAATYDDLGARQSATLQIDTDGTYRFGIAASADPSLAGNIAIGPVQLEAVPPGQVSPTPFQNAGPDGTVETGDGCSAGPAEVRDAFTRVWVNGAYQYQLSNSFAIDFSKVTPVTDPPNTSPSTDFIEQKFAKGNYNYRHVSVSLNLVGTGVHNCDNAPSSQCYASGFEQYKLKHYAVAVNLKNPVDGSDEFNFGGAQISDGRALTAEKYITLPVSSADEALISQSAIQRTELAGRPIDGTYYLYIDDSPSLRWERLEDVQIIIHYRYWSQSSFGAQ